MGPGRFSSQWEIILWGPIHSKRLLYNFNSRQICPRKELLSHLSSRFFLQLHLVYSQIHKIHNAVQVFLHSVCLFLCCHTHCYYALLPTLPVNLHFLSIYLCFRLVQSALHKLHSQEAYLLLHASDLLSHHADGDAVLGVFLDRQEGRTCPCLSGY